MLTEYRHYLVSLRRSENTIKLRTFYAKAYISDVDPLKARPGTVTDWVFSHTEWSPETVNAAISTVRSLHGWLHETGRTKTNPTLNLRPIRVPKTQRPIVTDDVLVTAVWQATSSRDRAILMLGGELGLRRFEIAGLHARDRQGEWLTITGKGNVTRILHMSPELQDALTELTTTGFYFPGRHGGGVHPSTIWNWVRKLVHLNTHALRHRAITTVYRKGGKDIALAQLFAGHGSPETTMVYVHVNEDDLRAATEAARFTNAATRLAA